MLAFSTATGKHSVIIWLVTSGTLQGTDIEKLMAIELVMCLFDVDYNFLLATRHHQTHGVLKPQNASQQLMVFVAS